MVAGRKGSDGCWLFNWLDDEMIGWLEDAWLAAVE
jgi:hypothetical protein